VPALVPPPPAILYHFVGFFLELLNFRILFIQLLVQALDGRQGHAEWQMG
jgi:hypothetical protein